MATPEPTNVTQLGTRGYGDIDQETMMGPGVWLHIPDRAEAKLVLMQEAPFRYMGHWMRGRVVPCKGAPKCDWCAMGIGFKPRYVYSMYDVDKRRCGILEVGPETAGQIRDQVLLNGGGVGICFKMRKAGGVRNGSIQVTIHHTLYRLSELPRAADPEEVLSRQWALPERER